MSDQPAESNNNSNGGFSWKKIFLAIFIIVLVFLLLTATIAFVTPSKEERLAGSKGEDKGKPSEKSEKLSEEKSNAKGKEEGKSEKEKNEKSGSDLRGSKIRDSSIQGN